MQVHETATHEMKKKPHTTRLSLYTARTRQKKSKEVDETAIMTLHFSAVTNFTQCVVSVVTLYDSIDERPCRLSGTYHKILG